MTSPVTQERGAELFELTTITRGLLRERMKERHANRMPDTKGVVWWCVDSEQHPGFPRLEKFDQRRVRGIDWEGEPSSTGPDYAHLQYDIRTEPLLRSIEVDGLEVGFITRNRYGAAVLNTDLLPMFDIDTKTDEGEMWDPRLDGEFGDNYPVTEAELQQALKELTLRPFGCALSFEEKFHESSRAFRQLVAADWPWNDHAEEGDDLSGTPLAVSVFSTYNGYRLVFDQPLVIDRSSGNQKAVSDLMKFTYTDDAYCRIALQQQLWRSRLTKKPWRSEELRGRPLQFEFRVAGGEVSRELVAPANPLLQPLWEVLLADNADLHVDY